MLPLVASDEFTHIAVDIGIWCLDLDVDGDVWEGLEYILQERKLVLTGSVREALTTSKIECHRFLVEWQLGVIELVDEAIDTAQSGQELIVGNNNLRVWGWVLPFGPWSNRHPSRACRYQI